jgi:serine/threonine-protein kinase
MGPKSKSIELSSRWARALTALVILGAGAAMWAVFQWGELLVTRAGGSAFCALDATFDCAKVWDSPLAGAVHHITRLPIAGWGVVWGILAMLAPLLTLVRVALGKPPRGLWSATLFIAGGGAATVVVMMAASIAAGAACLSCIASYLLVGGYVVTAWLVRQEYREPAKRGALVAASGVYLVYLGLLYPGIQTPSAAEASGRAAIAKASRDVAQAQQAVPDSELGRFLASLSREAQQAVSDSLAIYRGSPEVPARPPRVLLGRSDARMRITDFTDVLCSHCAELHETLKELRRVLPGDVLAIESRQYPLESACNPTLASPPRYPVRCVAAKAKICLEGQAGYEAFAEALYANHRSLTVDDVYRLAAPYVERGALEGCVESPETRAKLLDDIRWAAAYNLDGTPLVLVNGRKATPFAPFLYALALADVDPEDPAFAALPPPRVGGHVH